MDSKNVIIYVAGQRFSLRTKDTEEYVISTGEQVDLRIKGIQNDNPRFNRDTCAILAALDYLADGERLRSENANLKSEIQKLREEIRTLKEQKSAPVKPAKVEDKKQGNKNSASSVPYANPQSQRYGVQSFSNTKDTKTQAKEPENYHQFSIFDKEIK